MRQQIIELQNQRQEIAARQLGLLLAVRHHVFKRMDAAGDALEVERRGLALDAVQLAEQSAELLAELRVATRRLPEDAVDEVQAGLGAVQEGHQLQRFHVQHAQHHVDLRVGVLLRLPQLVGEPHAGGDVADGAQHVLDPFRSHDAVEVELQVAGLLAAVPVVHDDLELAQRVDALHQVLVSAIAPQELDVLGGRGECRRRHEILEQFLERQAGEVLAAEHAGQRLRPDAADTVVGIEQEKALMHGLEDVARLLLGLARGALMARAREPEVARRAGQRQRREHTRQQQHAQPRRGVRAGALQGRGQGRELPLQRSGAVAREQLRPLDLGVVLASLARQRAAGGVRVHVGLGVEGEDRIEHRSVLMPQLQRTVQLRRVGFSRDTQLVEHLVEALHRCLQVGQRLA